MREPFRNARVYLTTLLVLELLIGIAIIAVAAAYQCILNDFLADIERDMLLGQLFCIYILGIQIILTFVLGLIIWSKLWTRTATPNVRILLSIWTFFSFLLILTGIASIWCLFAVADATANSVESSLLRGIDLYYTCPQWKLLWDGLQFHKECCGVRSYKDWMRAAW